MKTHTLVVYLSDTPVSVTYEIDPGQKCIMNPPDKAQPGIPPSIDIVAVCIGDDDIQLYLNTMALSSLEDQIEAELGA